MNGTFLEKVKTIQIREVQTNFMNWLLNDICKRVGGKF